MSNVLRALGLRATKRFYYVYNSRTWPTPLENIDYLIHPLSFELFKVKANHLLVSINKSIEP